MQPCPLCAGTDENRRLAEAALVPGSRYDLVECPGCGVIRLDPLPTFAVLEQFYSAEYFDFDPRSAEGKGAVYATRLKRLKRKGAFLDIGCATGHLLSGIRQHCDWDVHGVEFGAAAVDYARAKLGLEVRQGDLCQAGYPDTFFDYIHLNNVLEHVLDPVALLRECRRIIKPDGRFFLAVPNGANDHLGIAAYYASEGTPARSHNGHVYFFPRSTLKWLLARAGFRIARAETGSIKRGLRNCGILPRKRGWRVLHEMREPAVAAAPQVTAAGVDNGTSGKPDIYYRFRFLQNTLNVLPGLHDFGLDFIFHLRPVEPADGTV